jgi:hypothetical protein
MTTAWMAAAGLAVVAGLGLIGCGGGSSQAKVASLNGSGGGATTTTTVSKQSAQKLWNEFAACMRQHGVNMADPVLNNDGLPTGGVNITANGGSKSATLGASQACQPQLEAATKASGKGPSTGSKVDAVKAAKFSKCMRAHGVPDFPDPQTSNGALKIEGSASGGTGSPPADLNPDSPVFQKAQKACGSLLPGKAGAPMGVQAVKP